MKYIIGELIKKILIQNMAEYTSPSTLKITYSDHFHNLIL